MAEGDGTVYNNFKEQLMLGTVDLSSDTLKLMLVTGHTLDIDSDAAYTDVSGDEESGTGYSAGGETINASSQSVTQDNSNDRAVFDAADVTWSGLDVGTPNYAILYDDTPSPTVLIAAWEIATASNGGDYTIQWNASGILLLT